MFIDNIWDLKMQKTKLIVWEIYVLKPEAN